MTTLLTLTLFAMCVIQPAPFGNEADFVTRTPECAQNAQDNRLMVCQDAQIQTTPDAIAFESIGGQYITLEGYYYDDIIPNAGWGDDRIATLEDQIAELRKKVEALEGLGDHIVDLTAMVEALGDSGAICEVYGHRWRNLEDVRSRHCDICGKHETLEWK